MRERSDSSGSGFFALVLFGDGAAIHFGHGLRGDRRAALRLDLREALLHALLFARLRARWQ